VVDDFRESAQLQIPIGALYLSHFTDAFRAFQEFPQIAVRPVIEAQPFAIACFRVHRLRHLPFSPCPSYLRTKTYITSSFVAQASASGVRPGEVQNPQAEACATDCAFENETQLK